MTKPTYRKTLKIKEMLGIDRGIDVKQHLTELAKKSPDLIALAGDVRGINEISTQYGKSFKLIGDFVAENLETGECFEAGAAFLPKDAAEQLKAKFDARVAQGGDDEPYVNFACVISVVPDKAQGFMYITKPAYDPRAITRKSELRDALKSAVKALPAPDKGKKVA